MGCRALHIAGPPSFLLRPHSPPRLPTHPAHPQVPDVALWELGPSRANSPHPTPPRTPAPPSLPPPRSLMEYFGCYTLFPNLGKREALASSAVRAAAKINAALIIVFTVTGAPAPAPPLLCVLPALLSCSCICIWARTCTFWGLGQAGWAGGGRSGRGQPRLFFCGTAWLSCTALQAAAEASMPPGHVQCLPTASCDGPLTSLLPPTPFCCPSAPCAHLHVCVARTSPHDPTCHHRADSAPGGQVQAVLPHPHGRQAARTATRQLSSWAGINGLRVADSAMAHPG